MKRRYKSEIADLGQTYDIAREIDLADACRLADELCGRTVLFIGSGGAFAIATFAADLHTRATGLLAVALTPLQFLGLRPNMDAAAVIISSSGSNTDARAAAAAAGAAGYSPVGLITCRNQEQLPKDMQFPALRAIHAVPASGDGFLATNSVLAMATLLARLYQPDQPPPDLDWLNLEAPAPVRASVVAVAGGSQRAVVADLEARVAEVGLGWVQPTDYRNLAHGRHVGLERRAADITVAAFITPEDEELAGRTLAELPAELDVIKLETAQPYPWSSLELFVASMKLAGCMGEAQHVDPGMPGVPTFGKRLYSLPVGRLVDVPRPTPEGRKAAVAGLGPRMLPYFRRSLAAWLEAAAEIDFHALVLDYDGTCCFTHARYDPPPERVVSRLTELVEAGLTLGFATGRGRSIHQDARSWFPHDMWDVIHVGLYNGTQCLRLSDELENYEGSEGDLEAAAERLDGLVGSVPLAVERRRSQVTVASDDAAVTGAQLLPIVTAVLGQHPALQCKAVASGHSVDVLPAAGGKVALVAKLMEETRGEVLAIGDQGQGGGNDFELLAANRWSLSVDRTSPDPSRCWNLDVSGRRGPDLLIRYLDALVANGEGFRFKWAANEG